MDCDIFGVQPSIFESTVEGIAEIIQQKESGLTLGEQLYTPAGSQSIGLGQYSATLANLDVKSNNHQATLNF